MEIARVQLRRARPSDAKAITDCVCAAYSHYIPRIGKPPGPMLVNYAQAIHEHQVWTADLDGAVVGALVLVPTKCYLLLDNIAVHPDAQGRGIGRMLLDLADREARRQGYDELRLYTHQLMTENIALYRRNGWEETSRAEQDGYARVFFRKYLEARRDAATY